jgi:hypothetical protein
VYEEPVYEEPVYEQPVATEPDLPSAEAETPAEAAPVTNTQANPPAEATGSEDAKSTGPWSPGQTDTNVPSDGTAGPRPPVIGGDGTGGLYDTSLPWINFRP